MELNLHSGGELIDFDGLRSLPMPEATATHHPIAHADVVSMVKYSLGYFGHEVVDEQHAIDKEGDRYFGLLALKSPYSEHTDLVGLRNSHDRTFPIGIAMGSQVFVCSNLAFHSEVVIKRKHTKNAKFALPSLVAEIIAPLRDKRIAQNNQFERYKALALQDDDADRLMMQMYRRGIINCSRIADVLEQWENPTCDYGPKTAYRLFNGVTWTLKPKVLEQPQLTRDLHELIDGECVRLN